MKLSKILHYNQQSLKISFKLLSFVLFFLLGNNLLAQCDADAGQLMPDPAVSDLCIHPGESVTFWGSHIPGSFPTIPPGFQAKYLLTKGTDLVIVQTHKDPFFVVSETAQYTVLTFVFDPTTFDMGSINLGVTTAFDINAMLMQGGGTICAALDLQGAPFSVDACTEECNVNAGKIMTGDPTTFCVDDGQPDLVNVIAMGSSNGENSAWLITDESGKILKLPASSPFDFEGAGAGTCLIWYIVYDGTITGLEVGKNSNDITGCFDFSNPISVKRNTGDDCEKPCLADAGKLMVDPSIATQCLDESGKASIHAAHVTSNEPVVPTGYTLIYLLSKGTDLIIVQATNVPNFTVMEPGKYTIHAFVFDPATIGSHNLTGGVSLVGDINGGFAAAGICANVDLEGAMFTVNDCTPMCDVDAGTIATNDETTLCVDDGIDDMINVSVSGGKAGTGSAWIITDSNGNILKLPANGPFNFEGAGAGTCYIYYLVYDGSVTGLEVGQNVNNITGDCKDLSNSIKVVRQTGCGCDVDAGTIDTSDPTTICTGDGVADPIDVSVSGGTAGDAAAWVITDTDNNILGLPAGPPFNLDPAGPGTCVIRYIVSKGLLIGLEVGKNTDDLMGCFDLSNGITVVRNEAPSVADGDISSTPTDECTGNGKNGSVSVTVTGGMAPYTYAWSNGGTTASMSGLAAGTYDVQITDAKGCQTSASVTVGTQNSGICIGDYVWGDGDRDGLQGRYEIGVSGVDVYLVQAGADGAYCTDDDVVVASTTTDSDGYYEFCCLSAGTYSIKFDIYTFPDADFILTAKDVGSDDEKDSDADPSTGCTDPFTLVNGQDNDFSFDAGIYRKCINITDGGTIGPNQTICRGATPDPICADPLPSGGVGEIEYLWMTTTNNGPFDPNTWTAIDGANESCYQPGPLFKTTFFILCSRRKGCEGYTGEGNIVRITVTDCRRGFSTFDAHYNDKLEVKLAWVTTAEEKGFVYEIERSADGENFEKIGSVPGNGPEKVLNHYSFTDPNPRNGHNFYRVKQIDNLSDTYFSDVRMVLMKMDELQELIVYPNPIKNNTFTLETMEPFEKAVTLEIISSSGKLLNKIDIDAGAIQQKVDLTQFPAGLYFIQIRYNSNKVKVLKISKTE